MWAFKSLCLFMFCAHLSTIYSANTTTTSRSDIEHDTEDRVTEEHRTDSLNILVFIILLVLTVLTVWGFKHYRLRFVHETGLAIIYGLIVGAIIRYTTLGSTDKQETPLLNMNVTEGKLPLNVRIEMNYDNQSFYYDYAYKGRSAENGTEGELEEKATFDPEIFFNVLLPAIIFHAGYSLKRRHFFRNFGAIITYAFFGTLVSCIAVGGIIYGFTRIMPMISTTMDFTDCLFFGALISATDPVTVLAIFHDLNVDVDLYACVFGESVLNDAVAIVLAQTVDSFSRYDISTAEFNWIAILKALGSFLGIFFGSFFMGTFMGCLTALLTKYTKINEHPLLETALFFLMSYSTFLAAEAAGLTGIVAVLFCGISQAHYTYNNLSAESKVRTKQMFEILNFLAENFVFTYIGVSTFTFQKHQWNPGFIFAAILAILVARAINIYPLTFLLNLGRRNKLSLNLQHMMMFSGLRGAIAFALSIRNTSTEARQMMFTTTLIIVIATVILCGGFVTQMLQWLRIKVGVEDESEAQNFQAVRTAINRQKQYSTMTTNGQNDGQTTSGDNETNPSQPQPTETRPVAANPESSNIVIRLWYKFDHKFMKPLLTHSRPLLTESCPACCYGLAMLLTTDKQISRERHHSTASSDTDLIIDDTELEYGEPTPVTTPGDEEGARESSHTVTSMDLDDGDLGLGISSPSIPVQTQLRILGFEGDAI